MQGSIVFLPTIHSHHGRGCTRGRGRDRPHGELRGRRRGRDARRALEVPALHHRGDVPARSTTTLRRPGPIQEMRVIYAHPQTHEQCSDKIEEWGIPVIHTSSNASSARSAKKTPMPAQSSRKTAAAIYILPIIVKQRRTARGTPRGLSGLQKHRPGQTAGEVQHPHRPAARTGPGCSTTSSGRLQSADQPDPDRVTPLQAEDGRVCLLPRLCLDARRRRKSSGNSGRSRPSRNSAVTGRSGPAHDRHAAEDP
jgi:hypothetical protein